MPPNGLGAGLGVGFFAISASNQSRPHYSARALAIIAFRVGRRVWRTGTGDEGIAALFAKEKGHPVKSDPLFGASCAT